MWILKRTFAYVWLVCLISSGCSGKLETQPAGAAKTGGVFRLLHDSLPETLDPREIVFLPDWEIASFIYEGLVGFGDQAGTIRPLLAESWTETDGGTRWIFKLRPDAKFQDDPCFPGGKGRKVYSRDVLYTLERIAKPAPECANWYLFAGKVEGIDDFHAGRAATIQGIKPLDDERIEIRLTKPYATFLKIMASATSYIVPREAVEFYGDSFANHPVGSGPFRLVRWKALERVDLARNAGYWRMDDRGVRLPYLDNIEVIAKADLTDSVLVSEFLKNETYLITAQEKLYSTLKDDLLNRQKCQVAGVLQPTSLRFLGFAMNTPAPLARHADLRKAVAMAYDRQQLVRLAPHLNLKLADTLVPPVLLRQNLPWHPFDPGAARAIFDAYRKELEQSPTVLAANFQSDDLTWMQESLSRLAVATTMRIRPANYYQYIVEERPSLFRVSYVPSFLDPEDFYCLFYSKSSRDINLTGYRNAEYDGILEAAMVEQNPAHREERFRRLEEILRRDVPAIYLTHGTPTYLIAASFVRGIKIHFMNPNLTETWLDLNHETRSQPQPAK